MIVGSNQEGRVVLPSVNLVDVAALLRNRDMPVNDRLDLIAICFGRIHHQRLDDIAGFREAKGELLGRIRDLTSNARTLTDQLNDAKNKLGQVQGTSADQKKKIEEIQEQLNNKLNEVAQQVLEVDKLREKVEKGQNDIKQLNVNIQDQAKRLEELPKLQEELKGAQADNKKVKAELDALEAKQKAEKAAEAEAERKKKRDDEIDVIIKLYQHFINHYEKEIKERQAIGVVGLVVPVLGWAVSRYQYVELKVDRYMKSHLTQAKNYFCAHVNDDTSLPVRTTYNKANKLYDIDIALDEKTGEVWGIFRPTSV